MNLKSITLTNFRCFEHLEVDIHPNLTVLIAKNGAGKTTILDALRIAVWPYVKGFDLGSQTGKSATIQIEDVRIQRVANSMEPQLDSSVQAVGDWPELFNGYPTLIWFQYRDSIKSRTNIKYDNNAKTITQIAAKLQGMIRNGDLTKAGDPISLPLTVYLGTGRLWYQGRHTSEVDNSALDVSTHSRTWGYLNCLTATSSYKQFERWYGWIYKSYRELQIDELEGKIPNAQVRDSFVNAIHVVQTAINTLTESETGWRNLQYRSSQNQQLVMEHEQHGYVPLSQLSDGLRNMVVMISDIAFRCYKLNPHFGRDAATRTSGIVMIDEVDMFLHPQWQQTVIGSLRTAFPKIQFIVTTHSPQVLSTVPSECIRILDNGQVYAAPQGTKGAESSRLLERVFGTDSRPKNDENTLLLNSYLDLVYKDQFEAAAAKRPKLDEIFGNEEPALTAADLYIENRQWELGLEEN